MRLASYLVFFPKEEAMNTKSNSILRSCFHKIKLKSVSFKIITYKYYFLKNYKYYDKLTCFVLPFWHIIVNTEFHITKNRLQQEKF